MATILREATQVQYQRRAYLQVDPVPNLPTTFFPKIAPFRNQSTQPERFWPRPPVQDFELAGTTTRGIPSRPRDPNIFRAPLLTSSYPRSVQQPEQISSLLLKTLVQGAPPFRTAELPNIFRRATSDLGFEGQGYLQGPSSFPFIPVEFPTPMRARATPQDFIFASTGISPLAPFNQDDWPIPIRLRGHHQDFWWAGVTTRGIPSGVATPFAQNDWPTLQRPRIAYSDSYSSPQILLVTPVLRPFSQSDWINPAAFRKLPIDWPWAGATTRGIPPVPPPAGPFAAVVLEAYGLGFGALELHWTASLGAFGYRIYIDGVQQPTILHQRIVVVTDLAIDTPYTFNVVCVNAFGADASILSNTISYERDSREIGDVTRYPWGDTPQHGYVIKVPLDGDE